MSIGKLKPKFYEFVDDDIIYDVAAQGSGSVSISESQDVSHRRIMEETPKLKTFYLKKGVQEDSENDYSKVENIQASEIRETYQEMSPNQKGIYNMGRSSYSTEKTPAFQLTMLRGAISSSLNYLEIKSKTPAMQIPQIEYEYYFTRVTSSQITDPSENYEFTSHVEPDGTYHRIEFEVPVMHLKEFNSFYEKENFDIEIFEVKTEGTYTSSAVSGSKEILVPLKFLTKKPAIVDDILVVTDESTDLDSQLGDYSDDSVQYYFDIIVDEDIPREELCQLIDNPEINNQFIDKELICPEARTDRFDIYASRVKPSDLEDCD